MDKAYKEALDGAVAWIDHREGQHIAFAVGAKPDKREVILELRSGCGDVLEISVDMFDPGASVLYDELVIYLRERSLA